MLKVELIKPPFEDLFQRMLNGEEDLDTTYVPVPKNPFIDRNYVLSPYSSNKIALRVSSDVPDRVISLRIKSNHPDLKINPLKETTVYLQNLQQTVLVDLAKGPNFVVAKDEKNGESNFIIINCRRWAGMLYAFTQDFYNNVVVKIDEQETAINSKYATRLAEPLFGQVFYLLSDIKSLQMLSVRLITKTLVDKASYEVGIRETGAAFTLNTPYLIEPNKTSNELDLVRYPLLGYGEFYANKIAHLWFPNTEIVRWKAFQTYVDNLKDLKLIDIAEDEVIVENEQTGERERHSFDFEKNKNFFANRRYAIDIYINAYSELVINFIAPGYPMDMVVDEYHLLGDDRYTLDMGIPFDLGKTFDSEEIDPWHDGYLGMSLIDRNELSFLYPHLAYDSTVWPLDTYPGTKLVYTKGYYCKPVDIEATSSSVSFVPTVSGDYDV